eukprot:s59_g14.t1
MAVLRVSTFLDTPICRTSQFKVLQLVSLPAISICTQRSATCQHKLPPTPSIRHLQLGGDSHCPTNPQGAVPQPIMFIGMKNGSPIPISASPVPQHDGCKNVWQNSVANPDLLEFQKLDD